MQNYFFRFDKKNISITWDEIVLMRVEAVDLEEEETSSYSGPCPSLCGVHGVMSDVEDGDVGHLPFSSYSP